MKNRKCPHCGKIAIRQNGKLYNNIKVFQSVHSACPHCHKKIVCGYSLKNFEFIIITQDTYNELMGYL